MPPLSVPSVSLLSCGAGARLAVIAAAMVPLWLCVGWALGWWAQW